MKIIRDVEDKENAIKIGGAQNLSDILSTFGPIFSEALLNFYAIRGKKEIYKNVINKKNLKFFKDYINYFDFIPKNLRNKVSYAYDELKNYDEHKIKDITSILSLEYEDLIAKKVWGNNYNKILQIRNKIMNEETNFTANKDYITSINANYASIFNYNLKPMDPRKAKLKIYKNTIKNGHNPEIYTNYNLFSLNNIGSIAVAFYGRAIEISDFNDIVNSTISYKAKGKNLIYS